MAAKEGGETRMEKAKAAANKILDSLPPSSTVQIIAGADRVSTKPHLTTNFDHARHTIDALEVSDLSTDLLPCVQETYEALGRGHSPNKEVYVFSDMQKLGWKQQPSALQTSFDKIRNHSSKPTRVVFVHCHNSERKLRNATITGIQPYSHFPQAGER